MVDYQSREVNRAEVAEWQTRPDSDRDTRIVPQSKFFYAEVAEWQTRMVQDHVPARVWGFNSPLRHQVLFQER